MSHDDHDRNDSVRNDGAHEFLREMLDDYVDGTLSASQEPRVDAHVADRRRREATQGQFAREQLVEHDS